MKHRVNDKTARMPRGRYISRALLGFGACVGVLLRNARCLCRLEISEITLFVEYTE